MELDVNAVLVKMAERGIRFQKDLAARVGVSENTVSDWIDGSTQPKLEQLGSLCRVLECSPNDLLTPTAALIPEVA